VKSRIGESGRALVWIIALLLGWDWFWSRLPRERGGDIDIA